MMSYFHSGFVGRMFVLIVHVYDHVLCKYQKFNASPCIYESQFYNVKLGIMCVVIAY